MTEKRIADLFNIKSRFLVHPQSLYLTSSGLD